MATKHEIRHDRIAKRVFEQASAEQLGRRRVKRLVEDKMFQSTERSKEVNKIASKMETDDGFLGKTWRFNHKLLGWLRSAAGFIPFLLPLSYLLDYFHKNKASFARQFLLAPDELALVDRYKKDIQWEEPEMVKEFVKASYETQMVKNLFYTALAVIGVALIALSAFFWWKNQQQETALNERLADYYAQVAETKIGQDSLHLAYRLNKEALRLNPTNIMTLRQDSFLQEAVPDFKFGEYAEYYVHDSVIVYSEDGFNKELKLLDFTTLEAQTLSEDSRLYGLRNNGGRINYLFSQSGNYISWVPGNELKTARLQPDGKTFKEIDYHSGGEEKELVVVNSNLELLGISYSADERHLFFLHLSADSLLISSAPLTQTSIGRPQRIQTLPYSLDNNLPDFAFVTSKRNEDYLSILTRETGEVIVFELTANEATVSRKIRLTPPTTTDNMPKIGTIPNGKGFVLSDLGRDQVLYLGATTYLKELKLYQGILFDKYKNKGILDLSRGDNLVTLHLNPNKEFIITHFGPQGAREFKTGTFLQPDSQLSGNRRPQIFINEEGTLVCLSARVGSVNAFSIKPDTFYTYRYSFTPDWDAEEDWEFDYFILGTDDVFVHLNETGYYAVKDGPNSLQRVNGELRPAVYYINDEQDLIYEEDALDTVWIKQIDPATNSLKIVDNIPYKFDEGRPSFQGYFNQPTPLTYTTSRNDQFSSNDVIFELSISNEYGSRSKLAKLRDPRLTVLDSAGTYIMVEGFGSSTELIKLLKNPADLPTHLANNSHLNTWRPGEKERYGIQD